MAPNTGHTLRRLAFSPLNECHVLQNWYQTSTSSFLKKNTIRGNPTALDFIHAGLLAGWRPQLFNESRLLSGGGGEKILTTPPEMCLSGYFPTLPFCSAACKNAYPVNVYIYVQMFYVL